MINNQEKNYSIAIILVSFIITLLLFDYTPKNLYADDLGYYNLAKYFHENTFLSPNDALKVRTYLYPLLLSFFFTKNLLLFLKITLIFQWSIFISSSYLFSRMLFSKYKNNAQLIFFALLVCNPIFLTYTCYVLTDILYTSFILLSLSFLILTLRNFKVIIENNLNQLTLVYSNPLCKLFFLLGMGCFFSSMAIAIRPAGIFMIPVLISVIAYIIIKRIRYPFYNIAIFILANLFFLLPVSPELLLNSVLFNKISFLPTFDLGNSQLLWGLENIKYGTNVSGVGSVQMFYPNPYYSDFITQSPIDWYFSHPLVSIKIFFIKFIGAFHWDYLQPYITDIFPSIYPLISSITIFILIMGLLGFFIDRKNLEFKIVILPFFIAWCSVTLPSAIELRFSLPPLAVLCYYSVISFYYINNTEIKKKNIIIALTFVFLLFQSIGYFIHTLSIKKFMGPTFIPIELKSISFSSMISDEHLNIDECDGKNNNYFIRGWFISKSQIVDNKLIPHIKVIIKKENKFYSVNTDITQRPDVSLYMNKLFNDHIDYTHSGFKTSFSTELGIGEFEVFLLYENYRGQKSMIATTCHFGKK